MALEPGLYVVATPIGNLGDITFRAVETLRGANLICAEDTRRAQVLLAKFDLHVPLTSLYGETEARKTGGIIDRIEAGEAVALISEAGTPCMSDPGQELVTECHRRGVRVIAIPGPSALAAALSASGLPAKGCRFLGFLPKKAGEKRTALSAHIGADATLVIFESARDLKETLTLARELFGDCDSFVWREGTKMHEEAVRAPISALLNRFSENVKGEITLLIHVPESAAAGLDRIREAVRLAKSAGLSAKDAADAVSRLLDIPKKIAYDLYLQE